MKTRTIAAALFTLMCASNTNSDDNEGRPAKQEALQFTYAWPFVKSDNMRPRGGSTHGPAAQLDRQAGTAWLSLQEPGLTKLERDRRAILAMAGAYRTSFEFIETIGFSDNYSPPRPYQSWGTEYVYIVDDKPKFISLQHIIVMFFLAEDGSVSEPMVVKHWRQDWQYEDRDLHEYQGMRTWKHRKLNRSEVKGRWTQSVFQVDDSPRYEAIGRWQHKGNYSAWKSENTWRPLPRREFSVRNDYQVLSGTNRHTITPTGWVQEEDNLKLKLSSAGEAVTKDAFVAREAGLNRYERIIEHDWTAGDAYWKRTGKFWADVREAWKKHFAQNATFSLIASKDGLPLYAVMFEYAGKIKEADSYNSDHGKVFIAETLSSFSKQP